MAKMNDVEVTLILSHPTPRSRGRRSVDAVVASAVMSPEYKRQFKALCKEKNEIFDMLCEVVLSATRAARKGQVPQALLDDEDFCEECYQEKIDELRELRGYKL